ncbi:hypothetical protein CASFOL_012855 [Castilleja foliolosa]|uniref:Uncharacterized protein n=1 Tax=Castilleja foliolosa TaxID=1961234 RepID=A0ABD3DMD3_9LAMI
MVTTTLEIKDSRRGASHIIIYISFANYQAFGQRSLRAKKPSGTRSPRAQEASGQRRPGTPSRETT